MLLLEANVLDMGIQCQRRTRCSLSEKPNLLAVYDGECSRGLSSSDRDMNIGVSLSLNLELTGASSSKPLDSRFQCLSWNRRRILGNQASKQSWSMGG